MRKGNKKAFVAVGYYSDHSSKVLTDLSIWRSNNKNIGYFVEPGQLIGKALGFIKITATKDGVTSNTVDVEVTNATVTSLTVTPSQVLVAKGQTQQLLATATYSDGTSSDVSRSVTWTPDEPQTATVTPTGLLSGDTVATTTVEAFLDGVTSNTVDVEVTNAIVTSLTVTPSQVLVAKGQTQQLLATATYSDGTSSDVSRSVTWTPDEPQTATVTPTGLLSGDTVATTTVEAFLDGVTSNTVDVEVYACRSTGASCLDIFDTGSGKLFTNSPSKTFLDSRGGSTNKGFTQEIGTSGPTGDFYIFDWNNADSLCDTYNTKSIAGRTNWRLATVNELRGLFNTNGNMFTARGWAVRINYWTSTSRGPGYANISLRNGYSGLTMPSDDYLYASCVSVP
ncbi:Ig-like domain-containing protein [Vibrio splendidus]